MPHANDDGPAASAARSVDAFSSDGFGKSARDLTGRPVPAERLRVRAGFHVELLYAVPLQREGSWVSLAVDPSGRLLASDQFRGLYRVTLPDRQRPTSVRVEKLKVDIGGAQGLLCAFGSLYAVVNGHGSGLYRLRDTDGDDQYDDVRLLRAIDGAGEHGPHAVVVGPDGRSLFINGGNGCFLKQPPERSRVPRVWAEDRLQVRLGASDGPWGDNRNGGWVCQTDPDGKQFELFAMGLRNPYDIAFNRAGELFTFDADMEWDVGTPWYRPTRVNQVISGADFGWRAGSSKWPADYFDSCGSVVDVGLSSPTGLTFGYAGHFPEKYREALLMGDWSLGNIYAVFLQADGASYRGEFEPLVTGAPLPVTDLVINPKDGALYFVTGGRNIASGLYRLTYDGALADNSGAVQWADTTSRDARQLRHQLEQGHRRPTRLSIDDIWPHLASQDRTIRFAARIALEHRPLAEWLHRACQETEPRIAIAALLAAARHVDQAAAERVLMSLLKLNWQRLSSVDRLDLLRACMVLLSRHGRGPMGTALCAAIRHRFRTQFPNRDERLNRELAELLVFAAGPPSIASDGPARVDTRRWPSASPRRTESDADQFAAGTRLIQDILSELENAPTQERQIHYVMCLRDMRDGWTLPLRRRLFAWFQQSVRIRGGVLFGDYLDQIREAIESRLNSSQRHDLADVLALPEVEEPLAKLAARPRIKERTTADLLKIEPAVPTDAAQRAGRHVFNRALCYRCHRFAGQGGMIGPDLTNVARRLNDRDLCDSIADPDHVISDQYRAVQIVAGDGRIVKGKITDISGNTLVIMNDPLNPADLTMVQRDSIEQMRWSPTSPMPAGLLDTFTDAEIADLLRFLKGAGTTLGR